MNSLATSETPKLIRYSTTKRVLTKAHRGNMRIPQKIDLPELRDRCKDKRRRTQATGGRKEEAVLIIPTPAAK